MLEQFNHISLMFPGNPSYFVQNDRQEADDGGDRRAHPSGLRRRPLNVIYTDDNADKLVFRLRITNQDADKGETVSDGGDGYDEIWSWKQVTVRMEGTVARLLYRILVGLVFAADDLCGLIV